MSHKPIIIILGEPYSTFQEIVLKSYKNKIINKIKYPLIFVGSVDLFEKQMKKLKYSFRVNKIKFDEINNKNFNNRLINFINVDYKFKKIFDKVSTNSNDYINKCFEVSLNLFKKKKILGIINGPVSKKTFLKKKFLGVTEYLAKKTKNQSEIAMLIYNSKLSVSPITTHLPIKMVSKNISRKKIISKVKLIDIFFKKRLKKKPKIAILGLNPHCESINKFSEEKEIIIPSIKQLLKKKINVEGPFSADTFFFKKNIKKFDVVIGMYHDQVLVPIKTLFNFNAINITLGLPFVRISPDHGTNNQMIGMNKSDYKSFEYALGFFNKINAK